MKKNLSCPSLKKLGPRVSQSEDAVKPDIVSKKTASSTNSMIVGSKPLQSMNHQNQNSFASMISSDSVSKKAQPLLNGAQPSTVPSVSSVHPNPLPTVSQSSPMDIKVSEIVESIRTSLANSLVSVTPVQASGFHLGQNNQLDNVGLDSVPKMRNAPSNSSMKKSSTGGVDIINLQKNGMDSSSIEVVPKKRSPVLANSMQGFKQNSNNGQSFNMDSQDLSKSQTSSVLSNIATTQSSHLMSTHRQSLSPHNSIKVSSVSAINMKLSSSQSQTQPSQISQVQGPTNKASVSHPQKAHNHQSAPVSSSSQLPATVSFSSPSVISHGLETSGLGVSSSLTITPVKSGMNNNNSYYQQAKMSGHQQSSSVHSSSQRNNSSVVSHGSSNIRSEVIVTPSTNSSMPHIKSTNVNYSVSSANNVSSSNNYSSSHSSGNNFSTSHSASGNNFSNSRGVSSNNYPSSHGASGNGFSAASASSDNVSVRTHRTMANHSDSQASKNQNSDKVAFSHPSRSEVNDKSLYMSSSMWPSQAPMDAPRSSASSSPSSVKSVTPSPEKTLVSRKDRILQDSRERGGNEPVMPTLSGPYRSSNNASEPSSMRNQPQVSTLCAFSFY